MKYFVLITVFLLSFQLNAADKNVVIDSKVKEATVFQRGAQITRTAKQFLTPGSYFLVFDELTFNIESASVQVEGKGEFTILSVSHQRNYMREIKQSEQIKILTDSIEVISEELAILRGLRSVYQEEKSMINTNKKIMYGTTTGFAIEDLEEMSDFFRTRLSEILNMQLEINQKEKRFQTSLNKLNSQLAQLKRGNNQSSEIVVEVAVKKNTPASFVLKYFVPQAGWTPIYDIRASGPDQKIKLAYNAQVFQSTGINWENVKLKLSTSNPTQRTDKPVVSPYVLRFVGNMPRGDYYQSNVRTPRAKLESAGVMAESDAGTAASATLVTESQLNINFEIDIPYNIPSDNKKHTVNVKNEELDADYYYYAAPKYSDKTLLIASIGGWEKYQLISGQASIYYQGTFLGKTFIDARNTKDKLDISFGEDRQVVVKRTRIEDYCDSKLIGNNKKENIGLAISAKNTKSKSIKLIIEDQIPISSNKEIEVTLEDQGDAELDEKSGTLKWQFELKPAQTVKREFKYIVKFPKDKKVNL